MLILLSYPFMTQSIVPSMVRIKPSKPTTCRTSGLNSAQFYIDTSWWGLSHFAAGLRVNKRWTVWFGLVSLEAQIWFLVWSSLVRWRSRCQQALVLLTLSNCFSRSATWRREKFGFRSSAVGCKVSAPNCRSDGSRGFVSMTYPIEIICIHVIKD